MKIMLRLFSIIAFGNLSCYDEYISPLQKLEFRLAVLNKDMEQVNTLEKGMDFYLGLELVNNSTDTISFSYSDSRRLMAQFFSREDFLLIYRVDAVHFSPVGKPYNPDIEPNFVDANL